MPRILCIAALLCLTMAMSACVNSHYDKNTAPDAGTQSEKSSHTIVETAVADYMADQADVLKQQWQAERKAHLLTVTSLSGHMLDIATASDATFASGSAELSPDVQQALQKVADVLKKYDKTVVHVVGHTDSAGSTRYNRELSRKRAASVARFLVQKGVDAERVLTWGRGESGPVASNATSAGRAANRRVDIIVRPIVQGQAIAAFSEPPDLRGGQ